MRELSINEVQEVNGGIIWGVAWTTVGATFAATDASLNIKRGFAF